MSELLKPVPLTPDLARTDPEVYKSSLLHLFTHKTKHGKKAWDFMTSYKSVSEDKITLNTETWQSVHNGHTGTITLGTGVMPTEDTQVNFPFETNSFDHEKTRLHILSHESAHFIGDHIAEYYHQDNPLPPNLQNYVNLVSAFQLMRAQPDNKGVTSHARADKYVKKGSELQGHEDMIDLMAYYLLDPEYLKRYLQFLGDPENKDQFEKIGLKQIPETSVEVFYNIIDKAVQSILQGGIEQQRVFNAYAEAEQKAKESSSKLFQLILKTGDLERYSLPNPHTPNSLFERLPSSFDNVQFLRERVKGSALDLGSGGARPFDEILPKGNTTYIDQHPFNQPNFIQADIRDLRSHFPDHSVDTIRCSGVFSGSELPEYLSEMLRIAKEDGIIILSIHDGIEGTKEALGILKTKGIGPTQCELTLRQIAYRHRDTKEDITHLQLFILLLG